MRYKEDESRKFGRVYGHVKAEWWVTFADDSGGVVRWVRVFKVGNDVPHSPHVKSQV